MLLDALNAGAYYRPRTATQLAVVPKIYLMFGLAMPVASPGGNAMDPVGPLRRELSPSGAPGRSWRIISIVFAVISVILLVAVLASRPQRLEVFSVLLIVLVVALCVVIFLHARFLLQLHHEHRETWAEADALRKATLALTQDLRMDYVLDTLLQSLAELIPCECARVLLVEADSRLFVARERMRHDSGKKVSDYPLTLDAADFPLLQSILTNQNSVLLPDTKQEKEWHAFKGHTDVRSWLCVPLVASRQTLGVLSVGHSQPNSFLQEHLRLAKSLAIPAAAAIQNARLYERAEIYGSELEKRLSDLHAAQKALEQAEGDRRISEDKFQKVFCSSPIAFSITTLEEGRFLDVNAAFERRYGYSRAELIGHTVHELRLWEDFADRARLVAELKRGGSVRNVVTQLRTKSGEIKLTAYSAEKIQFDGQVCILAVSEDLPKYQQHMAN